MSEIVIHFERDIAAFEEAVKGIEEICKEDLDITVEWGEAKECCEIRVRTSASHALIERLERKGIYPVDRFEEDGNTVIQYWLKHVWDR